MINKDEEYSTIQFPAKTRYYNLLREMKGNKVTWFDFLCREKIVQFQHEKALEEEMHKKTY